MMGLKNNLFLYLKYILWFIAGIGILVVIYMAFNVFRQSTYINLDSTAVVKELQSLNRYETSSFTIEKIIDAGKTGGTFSDILFGDKLLLIAHGQVIAGFDFSKLNNESVSMRGSDVTLDLPAPEILISRIDESKTRVYDRTTGIFTKGDKDLESKARAAAEASLRQAACDEGILTEATNNGRNQLTTLLKALGFTTVIVNIPKGSC